MKRRGLQLSGRQKTLLYTASLSLFLSGSSWAWIHHLDETGRASDELLKWKTWLISIHGMSAMVFVLTLGMMLATHVRRSWHARKNRKNGIFFLGAVALLTLSGYLLYYLGDENWRAACSRFHLWLGLAAPFFLVLHIWMGLRATSRD
jgi:hypothetical protein